jgi:SecD/SecF fusion protein
MLDEKGFPTDRYELYAIKTKRGSNEAPLQGDRIVNATSSLDPMTNEVTVILRMDNQGSKTWADLTTRAAQDNNREIAIALDNEVVSAPRVNEPIVTGDSRISGNLTIQEGQDLANILQIGKLPASTTIIQESLVGPSLGADNIKKSLIALALSMVIVVVFMVLYYSTSGIVAIIALFANLFFLVGALSSMGTVLTLPGIAGIILTIGMAIDANIIIYERAREELRAGKSLKNAIADGFKNSYSAIIDANLTTILTGIVMAYFGLGPIRGYAITLLVGVLTSFFTAVIVGRLIVDWWVGTKGKSLSFWTEPTKNVMANLNINWLSKRKYAYMFSGALLVIGIISFAVRGFELGVDFKGGYSYNVQFEKGVDVDVNELRNVLTESFDGTPIVKAVDAFNTYNITTSYLIDDNSPDVQDKVLAKLYEGVNQVVGGNLSLDLFKLTDYSGTHISSFVKVGPTIADDIKKSSFYAGIFALLLTFIYILIRFNKWQFSLGAVLALFHDAFVVLVIFSVARGLLPFSMEIDQVLIAALLTIIGYSLNDTIVIYDRIRENFKLYPGQSTAEVVNSAINSTMSRTLITSLTLLFVVVILFVFGGASLKGFAFALVIGLISGTYSTVFIAAPILVDLTGNLKSEGATVKTKDKKGAEV